VSYGLFEIMNFRGPYTRPPSWN